MAELADALVIGGGVIGCGVAYYLEREGVKNVLLVEGAEYGCGATAGSMGNVRQQFGTPLEVECSRRGLQFWKTIPETFGIPVPFHQDGYLMVTADDDNADTLRKQAQVQRECGMPNVQILEQEQIKEVAPYLEVADLVCGSWTPEDGHVIPQDGLTAYLTAARHMGARAREGWPVSRVERSNGAWHAHGPDGEVVAPLVIIAAGTGTRKLLQPFGIEIDIGDRTHYGLMTEPVYQGRRVPTTIDIDTGLCVEREGEALMLAMLGRNPPPRSHDHLAELFMEAAAHRAPALTDLSVSKHLTAHPAMGGDGQPYVGEVDRGLWCIAFVGHGAMHGPPVAEAVVKAALGRPDPTLDISEWDPRRTPGPRTVLWRRNAQD